MQELWNELWTTLTTATTQYLPRLVAALAVLIGFWLVALIVSAVVRAALRRTELDNRVLGWLTGKPDRAKEESERWIARAVFWLVMLFGILAFFNTLNLLLVAEPINRMLAAVLEYVPRVLSALLLMLLAWIVAAAVRFLLTRVLQAVKLDERLRDPAKPEAQALSLSQTIGSAAYWLVFLLFLPLVLEALALEGLLEPLNTMLSQVLGFLPNLFAGLVILFVGWFGARIARQVVTNLLAASGFDRIGQQTGVGSVLGGQTPSALVGTLVYALILIPVAIAALDALQLGAISEPAGRMLETILQAIPAILTAAVILAIAYVVGRFAAGLVTELLARAGFDGILDKLGLGRAREGAPTPSAVAGYLVLVATLYFASIEAARHLQLAALAELLVRFAVFAGHVLLGLVIFGVGLYVANLAANVIRSSRPEQRGVLASLARVAILVLAAAMALREMGLGEDIVNILFGAVVLALSLGAAIAIGLGARELAGREVERLMRSLRGGDEPRS